ncbi:MAG: hypothetical protein OEY77_14390, partial [Nitrospira sp.]|nr:hypothetical protein [Nitrospira sp.]
MGLGRSENIGKTIEVKSSNRPIKVAFLVPHQETVENHMVLDGVFHESYSRWAGAYTLIVPTNSKDFLHPEYGGWLEKFDPDFIYTYLEIEPSLVETIDKLCSPIACLKHERRIKGHEDLRWRSFIPDWGLHFRAMSSVTTIPSPSVQPAHFFPQDSRLEEEITVATEYLTKLPNRWLSDNFGTSFNAHNVTYPVPGLYKTLSLVPSDLPQSHTAGTERCSSMADMLTAISTRKARPIARYAMAHSEAIWRTQSYPWSDCFNLFVGSSILDRLHFWNARHFTPSYAASLGSLILEPAFFKEPLLVTQLGQYLNNNNFLGQSNSPAKVSLRSHSQAEEVLHGIADILQKQTYNLVAADNTFNHPSIPKGEDLKKDSIGSLSDVSTFKLNENSNTIVAKLPKHLAFLPSRFQTLADGQWITELEIQRHNNLSKFSNIVDTWELPRRHEIVRAFTTNQGKVTANHRLAVLAAPKDFPYTLPNTLNRDFFYDLSLPDDGEFFQWLISPLHTLASNDLRTSVQKPCYEDIRISDKGQSLRGVISMVGNLS